MDFSLKEVMDVVDNMGIKFKKTKEAGEFLAAYQELNNHTHKPINRGYSPYELYYVLTKNARISMVKLIYLNDIKCFQIRMINEFSAIAYRT